MDKTEDEIKKELEEKQKNDEGNDNANPTDENLNPEDDDDITNEEKMNRLGKKMSNAEKEYVCLFD